MIEPNNPQTRGQEVIFFNNDDDVDDVEADAVNPTTTSIDVAAGVDVDAPTDIKRGLLTVKNAAYGCGILCFVSAIGFAAGVGFAGTTNTAIQANLLSEKMALDSERGAMTSGKSGKGQAGLLECVVEPIGFVVSGGICAIAPDEPPSKKEFDKYVWKPYMKECGGFWSDVFYTVTRILLWFCNLGAMPLQMMPAQMTEDPTIKIPSACSDMVPSIDDSMDKFVSSIFMNEENTTAFMGLVAGCANEVGQMEQGSLISGISSTILNVGNRRKLLAPDDLLDEE